MEENRNARKKFNCGEIDHCTNILNVYSLEVEKGYPALAITTSAYILLEDFKIQGNIHYRHLQTS